MPKFNIDKFKHVTVILNTPFLPNGSVNQKAAKAIVNYFLQQEDPPNVRLRKY